MIKIINHVISKTNVNSGDTFSINLYSGYEIIGIFVVSDIPYLVCVEDDSKELVSTKFMYADDNQCFEEKPTFLGKIDTILPATSFYIFQIYW